MKSLADWIFFLWLILLLPWIMFSGVVGMAFDAGFTWKTYLFVWSVWTYPVPLIVAIWLRRRSPWFVLLPFLNVIGVIIAG